MSTSTIYYPGYSQVDITPNLRTHTITAVTNDYPMQVTTDDATLNYTPGMIVTFLVPSMFGMTQLNTLQAQVLTVSGADFTADLDTTNFDPFAYPSPLPNAYTPPSVVPYASGMYLPPLPLPYGNQDSFEGVTYNAGIV